MNQNLQKLFSRWYTPFRTNNAVGGASSVNGTASLRIKLEELFKKYNIKSIFDAGSNDCNWMILLSQFVDYKGGDISAAMVSDVWYRYPDLDVVIHDVTTDAIPAVDLLFVRDVTIHLNNDDKRRVWQNWYSSSVPWILITHSRETNINLDFDYTNQFPFSPAHWELEPWNFPAPREIVDEYEPGGKCMGLWHRDQFKGIL